MDSKTFSIALLFLLAGIWFGFNLESKNDRFAITVKTAFQKPVDTHAVGNCQSGVGIRQIKDENLPLGPIYLTYQGKTIGIEYQITKKEIDEGKQWTALPLQQASVNHADLVWIDHGDDMQKDPHYDARFYTITRKEQEEVTCRS